MNNGATGRELNFRIARRLEEVAQLLHSQGANTYRVQAYRRAAETLRHLSLPAEAIFLREGEPGLRKLAGVGAKLARSIATMIVTGRLPMLARLRGESDADTLLTSVPGIGKRLATRLRRDLDIQTLEQLEAAAHDGRLRDIAGMGAKKIAGIIDSLSARLGRVRPLPELSAREQPEVAEILDVDREYREEAAANALPTIAPRRFNPKREAWLPVLHTTRGTRHYTALFSNTARAHERQKTKDWVVIYYDGQLGEQQCTVITSRHAPLAGKRIVRGREPACLEHYQHDTEGSTAPPVHPHTSAETTTLATVTTT